MARLNPSWQSQKPQQCIFCLALAISVLVLTMETFVCSVSTDFQHSDVETNVLNGSPMITTNLEMIYINSLASLLKSINNLAIMPDNKDTAMRNRKRRNSDSEPFPFEAPEICTLSETELDQIHGLFVKFTAIDKNFCNVQKVERPKQIGPTASSASPSKLTDTNKETEEVDNPVKTTDNSSKLPASSSKMVAVSPVSTNSTKSVSNPTKNSKLISSVSKSSGNSTKLATSPTTSIDSTGVVNPTKSVVNATKPIIISTKPVVKSTKSAVSPTTSVHNSTKPIVNSQKSVAESRVNSTEMVYPIKSEVNATKPIISSTKSVANIVQLAVSSMNSVRNSTKPIVNSINSTANSTTPLLIRRNRSLPTKTGGECNKLIESIQLSTGNIRSAYCDLSNTEKLDPRYNEKKAAYETEVAQLREKLDNKDLQIEQKYKTKIDELNKDFQKLEKNMRYTVEKLESEERLHMGTKAKLILAHLKTGDIKEALEEFEDIDSRNNTIVLITLALLKEFRIPTENVIHFTRGLKHVEPMVQGTIHIFHELEKKQGFIELKIVSLLQITVEGIIQHLVELESEDKQVSSINIDRAAVSQLVLLYNKLDYLNIFPFKYN